MSATAEFLELEDRRGLIVTLASGPEHFAGFAAEWEQVSDDRPDTLGYALHAICTELMQLSIRFEELSQGRDEILRPLGGLLDGLLLGAKEEPVPEGADKATLLAILARQEGAALMAAAGLTPALRGSEQAEGEIERLESDRDSQ